MLAFAIYKGPDRRIRPPRPDIIPVRLVRKYADEIDGIDLSRRRVGDRVPLPASDARLLMAEGWAEPVPEHEIRSS